MRAATIILAAGGTGGHLFPAEALAQVLVARGWRVLLVTDTRGKAWASRFPAEHVVEVPASTLAGGAGAKLRGAWRILSGIRLARRAIVQANSSVVVGFGGYPAFPASAAAILSRRPLVLHEQNAVLGRTNRALVRFSRLIATSLPHTEGVPEHLQERVRTVGNPVRDEIARCAREYRAPETDREIRLLVIGGSQGAHAIAEAVPQALAQAPLEVRRRLRVALQVRAGQEETASRTLADAGIDAEVATFFDDMGERLADAHLVISRAGASTVAEIAVAGRPAILVPLPGARDDQQTLNARALAQAGAAQLLPETRIGSLPAVLVELLASPERLSDMADAARRVARPNAAHDLADLIDALLADRTAAGIATAREGRA